MKTRPILLMLASLLVVSTALSGCGGDDDCWTERRCQSIGGDLTCVWVKVCPGDPPPPDDETSSSLSIAAIPGDTWDVGVGFGGVLVDGVSPLAVELLGAEAARTIGRADVSRWWFHGWPSDAIRAAAAAHPGTDIQQVRPSPTGDETSTCRALSAVDTDALFPLPERVALGEAIPLYAPLASELVPFSSILGLLIQLTPPGPEERPRVRMLDEGESTQILLDEAGRWHVRMVLVARALCEANTVDVVLLQDQDIDVLPRP